MINLLKTIDEIYHARFLKESSKPIVVPVLPFYQSVIDYMSTRYSKQKRMLEQAVIDFIHSVDWYKRESPEVKLFH